MDFSYEVSRSLASCEGVLLLIDAAQGVQAQTLANLYLAMEHDLDDHPGHQQDRPPLGGRRAGDRTDRFGTGPGSGHPSEVLGQGRDRDRGDPEAIVARIPPPKGDPDAPLAALIFDAKYDAFRGTVIHCRIFDGHGEGGDIIRSDVQQRHLPGGGGRPLPPAAGEAGEPRPPEKSAISSPA